MIFGLWMLVAGSMLPFSSAFADAFTMPKLLGAAIGTLILWVTLRWRLRSGRCWAKRTPMDVPILAALAAATVSTVFSADTGMSLLGIYRAPFQGLLELVMIACVFYALAWSDPEELPYDRVRGVLLFVGGVVGFYALMQGIGFDIVPWELQGGRASSTFGCPPYFGNVMAILIPIALDMLLDSHELAGAGTLLLMAGGVWYSGSRGAALAAGGGCALVAYLHMAGLPRTRRALLGLLALTVTLGGAALMARRHSADSDNIRLRTWQVGARAFADNPVLGSGPDTFLVAFRKNRGADWIQVQDSKMVQDTAHNDWLQIAATLGLSGLAAYALLHLGGWLILQNAANRGKAGLLGAFLGALLASKLNAMPLSGEIALAVLLGSAYACSDRASWIENDIYLDFGDIRLASAALCAVLAVLMAAADHHMVKALAAQDAGRRDEARAEMAQALRLNPLEIEYRALSATQYWSGANARTQAEFDALMDEGAAAGLRAVSGHAKNSMAWDIAGTSVMVAALHARQSAFKAEYALELLDRAQALDPVYLPLMRRRLQLAWTLGLADKTAEISREYRRLDGFKSQHDQNIFTCPFCLRPWSAHRGPMK